MRAYSITYDLKNKSDYSELYEAIKAIGPWWHFLESTWIVLSSESSQQIWKRIDKTVDDKDFVLIMEVKKNSYGWLPEDAWNWIISNVPE